MKKLFNSSLTNVLLMIFCWAFQIFTAKLGFLNGAKIFNFTVQTTLITFIILALYILPKKITEIKKISVSVFGWLFLASAINAGLGTILSNAGIQFTSAVNAGFFLQFDIAFTILIAWLFIKEKINISKILTVLIIILGTFFLTTKGKFIVPHIGDIFILLACVCFATGTVLMRKIFKQTSLDSGVASLIRAFVGTLVLFLFLVPYSIYPNYLKQVFEFNIFDFSQIIFVILNSIFTIGLWVFLNRSLKISSASYVAMMASITPIIVTLLAVIFLKEKMELIQLFGGFLIISSGFITYFIKVEKN